MNKPSEFTLWAKTYTATRDDHMNGYHGIDHPTAFARASWEACKARVLGILEDCRGVDEHGLEYISERAVKEIESL